MEDFLYNAYNHYFAALKTLGYYSYKDVEKLLVLDFIVSMIYDYRGYVKKEDYAVFERALECLWGTSCLIPYADYLKMGKLRLGDMTEVFCRLKGMEDKIEEAGKDHVTMIVSDEAPAIEE